MNHVHEYKFWHRHEHEHHVIGTHNEGHYHRWAESHEHGEKSHLVPHTHKARRFHPGVDNNVVGGYKHHHALKDHEEKA